MTKRTKIISSLILALIVAGGAYYLITRNDNPPARTTSSLPTAQDDYSDGNERESSPSSGNSQGGAVDTGGSDAPQSKIGISSESGLITVTQPDKDGTVRQGSVIAGAAKSGVDKVQYRLVDEGVGVVAQGSLDIVNGVFSGKLQFTPRSETGRLDIFSFDSTGSEINTIELPVKLGK